MWDLVTFISLPEVDCVKMWYDVLPGDGHVVLELDIEAVVHHHHNLRVPGAPQAAGLSALSWQCLVTIVTRVCRQLLIVVATGGHVDTCQTVPRAWETRVAPGSWWPIVIRRNNPTKWNYYNHFWWHESKLNTPSIVKDALDIEMVGHVVVGDSHWGRHVDVRKHFRFWWWL